VFCKNRGVSLSYSAKRISEIAPDKSRYPETTRFPLPYLQPPEHSQNEDFIARKVRSTDMLNSDAAYADY